MHLSFGTILVLIKMKKETLWTYPYNGIISAAGDVVIKKPKVRTMDFHGLSLRPLVVKGLS